MTARRDRCCSTARPPPTRRSPCSSPTPTLEPLVAAHRVLEAMPPRHAPWPEGIDPRLVAALRGRGVEALYTHQARAVEAVRAGRNACVVTPDRVGQDALLQPAGPGRGGPRPVGPRALPLPHQGAGGRPAGRAALAGRRGRARAQDAHLRRRHAAERAERGAGGGPGRDHQPGHAPRRDPPAPHQVVQALREPAVRGDRRAAHLPRPVRQPRRQRHAPPAARLPPLRRRPGLHLRLGHHRQPRRAGRAADRGAGGADRRQRRAPRPQAHPGRQPPGREPAPRASGARRC